MLFQARIGAYSFSISRNAIWLRHGDVVRVVRTPAEQPSFSELQGIEAPRLKFAGFRYFVINHQEDR